MDGRKCTSIGVGQKKNVLLTGKAYLVLRIMAGKIGLPVSTASLNATL